MELITIKDKGRLYPISPEITAFAVRKLTGKKTLSTNDVVALGMLGITVK